MSHIEMVRMQNRYNRMQVLYLTGMSDEELYNFQFNTGLDWIVSYTKENRFAATNLLTNPLMWAWWLNEWNRREETLLPFLYGTYSNNPKNTIGHYRTAHQDVFFEFRPCYKMLETSYAVAVGQFNKKVSK
jgi:hypothetical protein